MDMTRENTSLSATITQLETEVAARASTVPSKMEFYTSPTAHILQPREAHGCVFFVSTAGRS